MRRLRAMRTPVQYKRPQPIRPSSNGSDGPRIRCGISYFGFLTPYCFIRMECCADGRASAMRSFTIRSLPVIVRQRARACDYSHVFNDAAMTCQGFWPQRRSVRRVFCFRSIRDRVCVCWRCLCCGVRLLYPFRWESTDDDTQRWLLVLVGEKRCGWMNGRGVFVLGNHRRTNIYYARFYYVARLIGRHRPVFHSTTHAFPFISTVDDRRNNCLHLVSDISSWLWLDQTPLEINILKSTLIVWSIRSISQIRCICTTYMCAQSMNERCGPWPIEIWIVKSSSRPSIKFYCTCALKFTKNAKNFVS